MLALLVALSLRYGPIDLPRHSSPPESALFPPALLVACGMEC